MTVLKPALFYGMGVVVMKGVSFIMLPVVTRYLPIEEYGRLDVLVTLMNVGSIVVGFGLIEAVYRFCGFAKTEAERNDFAATGFVLNSLLAVILLLFIVPFFSFITTFIPGDIDEFSL